MPRTQLEKLWLVGGAVVGAVLILVGYFILISPQKSETNSVNSEVGSARHRNAAAAAKIKVLQQENANLTKFQSDVEQAKLALPDTSGLPDFLRTLQSIGAATQTSITSLTVGAPSDLSAGNGIPGVVNPGRSAAAGSAQRAGTPSTGRVYGLAITVSVAGSVPQLNEFLKQLQTVQPRAVLITTLNETKSSSGTNQNGTTLSLNFAAFVAPASVAEQTQLATAAHK